MGDKSRCGFWSWGHGKTDAFHLRHCLIKQHDKTFCDGWTVKQDRDHGEARQSPGTVRHRRLSTRPGGNPCRQEERLHTLKCCKCRRQHGLGERAEGQEMGPPSQSASTSLLRSANVQPKENPSPPDDVCAVQPILKPGLNMGGVLEMTIFRTEWGGAWLSSAE